MLNTAVVNHSEASITLINSILTVSNLDVGNYTLSVATAPDENHSAVVATTNFTVKQAVTIIQASKLTAPYKKSTVWTIKVLDSNKNPIANVKVTLKIYTGSKYVQVTVNTDSKGVARYNTQKLSVGTHKVIISLNDKNYKAESTSSVKIIKQIALNFIVSKKTSKDGASLSIKVQNKATKKPVNGVKVKLLVYTGKSYKTIVLKSKNKGKYKGVCGYATNQFSVGTHKVVIKPVSIKYSGSKTTSMTIKKSAKKYPNWTSKL